MRRRPPRPAPNASSTCCGCCRTELTEIGAHEIVLTPYGALLATIPSNVAQRRPDDRAMRACGHLAAVQRRLGEADRAPQLAGRRHRAARRSRAGPVGGEVSLPRRKGRRGHRHGQRHNAARRRRQGRRRDRHDRGAPPAGEPRHRRTAGSACASRPTRRSAAACTRTCRATSPPTSPTRSTAREQGEIVYETFSADRRRCGSRASRCIPAGPRTSW